MRHVQQLIILLAAIIISQAINIIEYVAFGIGYFVDTGLLPHADLSSNGDAIKSLVITTPA